MALKITQYYYAPPEQFSNSSLYLTWAGQRECDSHFSIGPRMTDSATMIFVANGQGYVEFGNSREPIPLTKGDMVTIFPKMRYHYYTNPEDPWEIIWVSFKGTHAVSYIQDIGITPSNCVIRSVLSHSVHRTLMIIINTLGDPDDGPRLAATGSLYMLFAYLREHIDKTQRISENLRQDVAVMKATHFIEENYQLDLDVEMLCHHVNYSRSYLSRLFKAETGMTIPEYISTIRVARAKHLLTESQIPMREVAASVGINDPFYFSKIFKKHTGISPSEYRAENQAAEEPQNLQDNPPLRN